MSANAVDLAAWGLQLSAAVTMAGLALAAPVAMGFGVLAALVGPPGLRRRRRLRTALRAPSEQVTQLRIRRRVSPRR